jgi:hypothetical protein
LSRGRLHAVLVRDAPKLINWLNDQSKSAEDRFALYRQWVPEWSRRHDIAIRERDPRLVHENGDGKHVMILENGSFLWFDFEMTFPPPSVRLHLMRSSVSLVSGKHALDSERLIETVRHIGQVTPAQARLLLATSELAASFCRACDRAFKAKPKTDQQVCCPHDPRELERQYERINSSTPP